MAAYTDANVQEIFSYCDVPKCTTELNATMVKDLVGKCCANSPTVSIMLGGVDHGMLGNIISAALYATVSRTPFAVQQRLS